MSIVKVKATVYFNQYERFLENKEPQAASVYFHNLKESKNKDEGWQEVIQCLSEMITSKYGQLPLRPIMPEVSGGNDLPDGYHLN